MRVFGILEPFFKALSDGKVIRLTVAWVLRAVGVLGALGGVFWFLTFVGLAFKSSDIGLGSRSAGAMAGFLLFSLFGLAFGYLWLAICMFRARSVLALGDSHFTVLSILSILFRLNGELVFVTYALVGLGGCLLVWFTNINPFSQFGAFGSQVPFGLAETAGFLGGIELASILLLVAFFGIVVSYALAELSIVLVEIALNTRGIPAIVGPAQLSVVSRAAPAAYAPPVPVPAAPQPSACRQCGQPLEAGARFCADCGAAG